MNKPTFKQFEEAFRTLEFTGNGFNGELPAFKIIANWAKPLRSKKTRHIMKRAKRIIHNAIKLGLSK